MKRPYRQYLCHSWKQADKRWLQRFRHLPQCLDDDTLCREAEFTTLAATEVQVWNMNSKSSLAMCKLWYGAWLRIRNNVEWQLQHWSFAESCSMPCKHVPKAPIYRSTYCTEKPMAAQAFLFHQADLQMHSADLQMQKLNQNVEHWDASCLIKIRRIERHWIYFRTLISLQFCTCIYDLQSK